MRRENIIRTPRNIFFLSNKLHQSFFKWQILWDSFLQLESWKWDLPTHIFIFTAIGCKAMAEITKYFHLSERILVETQPDSQVILWGETILIN